MAGICQQIGLEEMRGKRCGSAVGRHTSPSLTGENESKSLLLELENPLATPGKELSSNFKTSYLREIFWKNRFLPVAGAGLVSTVIGLFRGVLGGCSFPQMS